MSPLLWIVVAVVLLSFLCSCCRLCVRNQEIQNQRRAMRRRHNVLVAVIPSGPIDGQSTPPFGSSTWVPMSAPPPYSQHTQDTLYAAGPGTAPAYDGPTPEQRTAEAGAAPTPPAAGPDAHQLASRLAIASPPPDYDTPPPYI